MYVHLYYMYRYIYRPAGEASADKSSSEEDKPSSSAAETDKTSAEDTATGAATGDTSATAEAGADKSDNSATDAGEKKETEKVNIFTYQVRPKRTRDGSVILKFTMLKLTVCGMPCNFLPLGIMKPNYVVCNYNS